MYEPNNKHYKAGYNLGFNSIGNNGSSQEVPPLPLPSKNSKRGRKIISALLLEGEAVKSNTQFNSNVFSDNDLKKNKPKAVPEKNTIENPPVTSPQALQRSHTTVKYQVREIPSVNIGEFEGKLLGSPNDGVAEEFNCAAMFDKQYLILGNNYGLYVMDFSVRYDMMKPIPLLRGSSFKKLQILDDYGVMIAIAGKKQMIRVYRLDSLLHLIKFVIKSKSGTIVDFSKAPPFLKKFKDTLQRCEKCGQQIDEIRDKKSNSDNYNSICSNCKFLSEPSDSLTTSPNDSPTTGKFHQRTISNISSYIQNRLNVSLDNMDIGTEEKSTVWGWATDYVKLAEYGKDCVTFDIKETKNYVYLTIANVNHAIAVYSCPVEFRHKSDFKFEFVQAYFIPETPKFINVVTDSFIIKQIIIGLETSKVVVMDCHSNAVTEPNFRKILLPRDEEPCFVGFTQIPLSCSFDFLFENPFKQEPRNIIPLTSTQNTLITPKSSPPDISNASVTHSQLTHDLSSANSLLKRSTNNRSRRIGSHSGDFDVSDSFEKRKSRRRSAGLRLESKSEVVGDPMSPPLSPDATSDTSSIMTNLLSHTDSFDTTISTKNNNVNGNSLIEKPLPGQVFVCTISNISHIVNINGEPYNNCNSIRWSSIPDHVSLLPTFNDIFVIAFEKQLVEVGSMKTGRIVKTVVNGARVKYLGESLKRSVPPKGQLQFQNEPKKDQFDNGIRRHVFWSCDLNDTYIYRGGVFI
ncbi:8074_t:CDS:2 [Diversispora eburnea]|uniref:8074_t:CDS:1 n=1 Tax=Diversispora eburnea TaxID=1213867 RepID=A0A9N8WJ91_9GLOM|nr:8074_t:CDS:2 [Diversispora eburnea]